MSAVAIRNTEHLRIAGTATADAARAVKTARALKIKRMAKL